MLDGWYCRSIANMQATESASGGSTTTSQRPNNSQEDYTSNSSSETEQEPNYRARYIALKKKLKYLIFENECFQDALRCSQKKLLKASRDRSFLLDRLLQYEKPDSSTSDSEDTASSDDDYPKVETAKRRKLDINPPSASNVTKPNPVKRRRPPAPKKTPPNTTQAHHSGVSHLSKISPGLGFSMAGPGDGHMTREEVERHLQSRQSYLELLPERAPPTVPTEMFSNDPSLDSESNDVLENSPNVDEWFD